MTRGEIVARWPWPPAWTPPRRKRLDLDGAIQSSRTALTPRASSSRRLRLLPDRSRHVGDARGAPLATLGLRGSIRARFASSGAASHLAISSAARPVTAVRTRRPHAQPRGSAPPPRAGNRQAAFEAALRYAQQRTTFGKPMPSIRPSVMLADMATGSPRRASSSRRPPGTSDDARLAMARSTVGDAYHVALDAMRVHGGFGYTSEFPVERYYRDRPACSAPTINDSSAATGPTCPRARWS